GPFSAIGTDLHERRRHSHRTTRDQLADFRTYPLGCAPRRGRPFSPRLLARTLFSISARTAVGDANPWLRLLVDGEREHQRRRPQLHSQPIFPFGDPEPHLWSDPIGRLLFFADDVQRGPHAASQRQFGSTR